MPTAGSRPKGALEREVLACLAAADHPLSAAEVQADLGSDLAYTTVLTTLSRLHSKHALVRTVDGRAYRYALAGGPDGAASNMSAYRMLRILDAGPDRASVLSRFVADLSAEDEEVLLGLLARSADQGDA